MSKKIKLTIAALVAAIVFIAAGLFLYNQSRYKVSADEAQNIAFKNAGVSASDVDLIRFKKDNDDGYATYDIKFYTASGKYEYVIDAETGYILEVDKDLIPTSTMTTRTSETNSITTSSVTSASTVASSAASPATRTQANVTSMTADEAKAIALADANLTEAAVIKLMVKQDMEHGVLTYEVDFDDPAAGLEYDYEINAQTGAIIEKSMESWMD